MVYKPIPSRPGYFAGSDGSIWSHKGPHPKKRKTRHLPNGRLQVCIFDGKPRMFSVSRLVLEAFAGPCPLGMECCHNNGVGHDNRAENLRWDTRAANIADAVRHGSCRGPKCARGERHYKAKLTGQTALDVVAMDATGATMPAIANKLGISLSSVRNILFGKNWSHVTGLTERARRRRPRRSPVKSAEK